MFFLNNKLKQTFNFDVIETTSIRGSTNQHYYHPMNQKKFEQYRYDIDMWNRLLFYVQEENNLLKMRLADVTTNFQDKKYIAALEQYQNNLTDTDAVFALFKTDIFKHNLFIENQNSEKLEHFSEGTTEHKKLSKEIQLMESNFNKMKFDFTNFIIECLA